ncbi:MAG TPA: hypothetical protein VEY93_16835 [Longimicrobium sp.]|nr:hypothetical protein [Longimicrobium sp.]
MSVAVHVDQRQGSTMGTVIAKVVDPGNAVAEVVFYVHVQAPNTPETGPYPPDIVRREAGHLYQGLYHGVYEMDVVLDSSHPTHVRAVALRADGAPGVAGTTQIFGTRTATPGGAVRVQDAEIPPAIVETLSFQGSVVQVQNRVATLNLDSRYAQLVHTHPYLPLAGGNMMGRLVVSMNTSNPNWGSGHAEFLTWDGSPAALGLHRSGYSALTLRHAAAGALDLLDNTGAWAQYRGGSFRAEGGRFFGAGGAFLSIDNGAASFLATSGGALQGRFQSLLLSDSYADAAQVPSLGLWAKGDLSSAGAVSANRVNGNVKGSGSTGGLSLYGTTDTFAVLFRGQNHGSAWGGHGWVNGDWATYFTMNNGGNSRGWIFRAVDTASGGVAGNVASISAAGSAFFRGDVGAAGRLVVGYAGPVGSTHRVQVSGSVLIQDGSLLVSGGNLNLNPGQDSYRGTGGEAGRIFFGGEPANYYVGKSTAGTSLNGGYAQLQLAYHTGIQVGAQARYGGVRFYSSEHLLDDGALVTGSIPRRKVFSVAEGDNDVRVTHNLRVGGDIVDSLGNVVPAVVVAGSAPATARPGTLWIQV